MTDKLYSFLRTNTHFKLLGSLLAVTLKWTSSADTFVILAISSF